MLAQKKPYLEKPKFSTTAFADFRVPKVVRTQSTSDAMQAVQQLKAAIIEELFDEMSRHSFKKWDRPEVLLTQLDMSAESFDITFKSCPRAQVDRLGNMLSGPFFTSKKYPIPKVEGKKAYPLVQIDLRLASMLSGETLGDGLLQLWHQSDEFCGAGLIQVIPRSEVNESLLTAFNLKLPVGFDLDSTAIPWNWNSDPLGEFVQCMTGYKSMGIQSQGSDLSTIARVSWSRSLVKKVEKFSCETPVSSKSAVHLFGTFSQVQYSAHEIGKKCLFGIKEWGASGNCQVFYDIDAAGAVTFEFQDATR